MNKKRAAYGLVDQVVLALSYAANPILAVFVLEPTPAGTMLLALQLAYFVNGLARAFVGEVLVAYASRYDGAERRRIVRDGANAGLIFGTLAALLLLGVWAAWPHVPHSPNLDLGDLVWIAPFIPAIVLQEVGRHAHLAARAPEKALVLDLLRTGGQTALVVAVLLAGIRHGGVLLACLGVGAAISAGYFLLRERVNPLKGRLRGWLAETRHLSGWFTATALVGQLQTLLVAFLVAGTLSSKAFAGLRFAQAAVLQPVQNLITAVNSLLVPRASRLAADAASADAAGATAGGAVTGGARAAYNGGVELRRQTRLVAVGLGLVGLVVLAVAVPLARPVLDWLLPDYAYVAPLALPIAIQAVIYLVQVSYTSALRGMHRARLLFAQYVVFTTVSLTGLVIGAHTWGLLGAAWGLTIGAFVGLIVMIASYHHAARRL